VLPISTFKDVKVPFRILRSVERSKGAGNANYLTLIKIPEAQKVALIIGKPNVKPNELEFFPLECLPKDDSKTLDEWLKKASINSPNLSSESADYVIRLVLGTPISSNYVKWTKDLRVLERNRRKPRH